MKQLELIQMNIGKHCKICQEEMDSMIMLMQVELKSPSISQDRRDILDKDISRLLNIKKQLRDLEINENY